MPFVFARALIDFLFSFSIQIAFFSLKVSSLVFILVCVCHHRMQDSVSPCLPVFIYTELYKCGVFLSAVSHVLYGERLGLLLDYIDPDAQHFIDCITLMFKTTTPMLYLPPALLRHTGAKVWKDHVDAWDGIFNQGNTTLFMKLMLKNTSTDFSSLNVVFQSRPMYPEYLQTAEEKSRCW